MAAAKKYAVPVSFALLFLTAWLLLMKHATELELVTLLRSATSVDAVFATVAQAIDVAAAGAWAEFAQSPPAQFVNHVVMTISKLVAVVNQSILLQTAILFWLTFTKAPLMKASRTATFALARCLAVGELVPNWVTAAVGGMWGLALVSAATPSPGFEVCLFCLLLSSIHST